MVIVPHVREFAWDDFARTSELVAAGEKAGTEAMQRINDVLRAYGTRRRRRKAELATRAPCRKDRRMTPQDSA